MFASFIIGFNEFAWLVPNHSVWALSDEFEGLWYFTDMRFHSYGVPMVNMKHSVTFYVFLFCSESNIRWMDQVEFGFNIYIYGQ